jgi:hypothetical protein
MSDEQERPYAGPGRETTPRADMPDDHEDVERFVAEVDEVQDEHLERRVDETFENRADDTR